APPVHALGRRDARDLPDHRPGSLPRLEERAELVQPFERLGDAELLAREPRLVAEHAFGVLIHGGPAVALVDLLLSRFEEPSPDLGVDLTLAGGELSDLGVDGLPSKVGDVGYVHAHPYHAPRKRL